MLGISDSIRDGLWLAIPQATEWQHIRNQIDAAFIFARTNFVNVFNLCHPFSASTECLRSERTDGEDRLQGKLLSVDVAGHYEERSMGIARKSEKTSSAVRCKHQREHDGKKDG